MHHDHADQVARQFNSIDWKLGSAQPPQPAP
jgi:hypothetical protein